MRQLGWTPARKLPIKLNGMSCSLIPHSELKVSLRLIIHRTRKERPYPRIHHFRPPAHLKPALPRCQGQPVQYRLRATSTCERACGEWGRHEAGHQGSVAYGLATSEAEAPGRQGQAQEGGWYGWHSGHSGAGRVKVSFRQIDTVVWPFRSRVSASTSAIVTCVIFTFSPSELHSLTPAVCR